MSRKLGVLVAIPIKGRKLVNRSGGKQSPYIQLKLGNDKKRTKASLIASVRFDVFQNHLDMHVMVIDEGKKNEVIGDGVLLLHEVIDKGELDEQRTYHSNGLLTSSFVSVFNRHHQLSLEGRPCPHRFKCTHRSDILSRDSMLKGTHFPVLHSDHRHHLLETHISLRGHILVLHLNLIPYLSLQWPQGLSDHQDLQGRHDHQEDQDQDQDQVSIPAL
ncbi:hypothetical protein BG000_002074 [Podila horticola]|nr:hypothetical protein BG000_002074 [Podila horticola]